MTSIKRAFGGIGLIGLCFLAACGGGGTTADIVAAPVANPAPAANPPTAGNPSTAGSTNAQGCVRTTKSGKIGQTATLSTLGHRVSGVAKVVDDCTIEVANFSYDGGGLQFVYAYGALNANYAAGFILGPNIRGLAYNNQLLVIELKSGDIDKMNSISIWCTEARVSFGDGVFR